MTIPPEQEEEQQKAIAPVTEDAIKPVDSKTVALWTELSTEATDNYNEAFKTIIRSDEYTAPDGTVYYFRMLNHKDLGKLKNLQAEKVREDVDWDKYVANYKERAKLLIKDMTDEKFDASDFFIVENLIIAWSIRASKGFRQLIKK